MRFYVSTAFLDTNGMGIPDHVINLETLQTPYPPTGPTRG
jgi:hypothetical protein